MALYLTRVRSFYGHINSLIDRLCAQHTTQDSVNEFLKKREGALSSKDELIFEIAALVLAQAIEQAKQDSTLLQAARELDQSLEDSVRSREQFTDEKVREALSSYSFVPKANTSKSSFTSRKCTALVTMFLSWFGK